MGYSLRVADSLEEADQVQRKRPFEALLLQTDAPNGHDGGGWGDGLPFGARPPVIAVGRERSIRDAVHSIRAGASDYVSVFPLDEPSLRSALAHALSAVEEAPGAARMTPLPKEAPEEFFTADERTLALWRLVLSAADSRMPFLIEGKAARARASWRGRRMIARGAGSGPSSRPTAACRPRRCSRASSSARRAGRRNPNGRSARESSSWPTGARSCSTRSRTPRRRSRRGCWGCSNRASSSASATRG